MSHAQSIARQYRSQELRQQSMARAERRLARRAARTTAKGEHA